MKKIDPNSPKVVLITALAAIPFTVGLVEVLTWAKNKLKKA